MLMLVLNTFIVSAIAAIVVMFVANMFTWKRVGGLVHFRCGRFGGSFYLAKAKPKAKAKPRRKFVGFGIANRPSLADLDRAALRMRMHFALRSDKFATAKRIWEFEANRFAVFA